MVISGLLYLSPFWTGWCARVIVYDSILWWHPITRNRLSTARHDHGRSGSQGTPSMHVSKLGWLKYDRQGHKADQLHALWGFECLDADGLVYPGNEDMYGSSGRIGSRRHSVSIGGSNETK